MATVPFAPVLCALILGIVAGRTGTTMIWAYSSFIFSLTALIVILFMARRSMTMRLKVRQWYWLPVVGIFFGFGLMAWNLSAPPKAIRNGSREAFAIARIDETIPTSSGEKMLVNVLGFYDIYGRPTQKADFKAVAYCGARSLRRGDIVQFRNRFEKIEPTGADSERYVRYLRSKGYEWNIWIPDSGIRVIAYEPTFSNRAADIRDGIAIFMEKSPLQSSAKGFLMAVILGDKASLSGELRDDMSAAGVAHMLALSGLHLGLVAMVLSLLLLPVSLLVSRKWRYVMIVLGLWLFTFLTGMSVSVVRAAVMASIYFLSLILEKKRNGANSLCAAAFFILLADPFALSDAGFQLSFVTCGALIAAGTVIRHYDRRMQPKRYAFIHSDWAQRHPLKSRIALASVYRMKQLVMLCLASTAAFIVSWPLTAYYFSTLSLTFLPANLLAGMLLYAIFIVAVIYFPLFAIGIDIRFLGDSIDRLYDGLEKTCHFFAAAGKTGEWMEIHGAVPYLYLISLLLLVLFFALRKNRYLFMSVTVMGASLVCLILLPGESIPESLIIGRNAGEPSFSYVSQVSKERISYPHGEVSRLDAGSCSIVCVDRDIDSTLNMKNCDCLVIGRNTKMAPATLIRMFSPKSIVKATYLDVPVLENYCREAAKNGIDLTEAGEDSKTIPL